MIDLEFNSTIRNVTNALLPEWDRQKLLLIRFNVRVKHYSQNKKSQTEWMSFAINKSSNYLTVWHKKGYNLFENNWGPSICHHDSCWRDSIYQEMVKTYFRLCEQYNPDIAPKNLDSIFYLEQILITNADIEINNDDWPAKYMIANISRRG